MPADAAHDAARTISESCLAVRARLVARAVTSAFEAELRPLGLTTAQLNLLVAAERLDGPTPGELGRRLRLEKSTLSRNLERMRERGWLRRDPGDARGDRIVLAAPGRALLVEALPAWHRAQQRVRDLLGDGGSDALVRAGGALLAEG